MTPGAVGLVDVLVDELAGTLGAGGLGGAGSADEHRHGPAGGISLWGVVDTGQVGPAAVADRPAAVGAENRWIVLPTKKAGEGVIGDLQGPENDAIDSQ